MEDTFANRTQLLQCHTRTGYLLVWPQSAVQVDQVDQIRALKQMDSAPGGPGSPGGLGEGSEHDKDGDVERSRQNTSTFDDLFADVEEGKAILLRRPDLISLCDPSISMQGECASCRIPVAGLEFNISTGAVESIIQNDSGIVNKSAELEGGQHVSTFFGVGDSLTYAFGVDYGMSKSVIRNGETHDCRRINASESENEIPSQTEDAPHPEHTSEEIAQGRFDPTVSFKTIPDECPIRLCQSIIVLSDGVCDAEAEPSIGIEFAQENERLVVKSISKHSHFGSPGSAVKEGHTVVGINEFIASVFTPGDAAFLVRSILASSATQLTITSIGTPKALTAWEKARKAAVMAGGGALVATGTALLVTPVHPLGHLFQLGGGAVLATEFEGARAVMDRAKARFDIASRTSHADTDGNGRTSLKDRWRRLKSRGNEDETPAS